MTDNVAIETDHPISITTTRPVRITHEGETTTVRIGASRSTRDADILGEQARLLRVRPPDRLRSRI